MLRLGQILVVVMFLSGLPLGARERPGDLPGDQLARQGAYRAADQIYRQALEGASDPNLKRRLLLRRLAVADVLSDALEVRDLCARLEALPPDPAARLQVALARANLAYRLGQLAEARRYFGEAERLAQGPGLSSRLALFACQSFAFWDREFRRAPPTEARYREAALKAWSGLDFVKNPCPPGSRLDPLEIMRAGRWAREWVRRGLEVGWDLALTDFKAALQWGLAANLVAEASRLYLLLLQADPECAFVFAHLKLEVAEGFPCAPDHRARLEQCTREQAERLRRLGSLVSEEQRYCEARLLRARAASLAFEQKPAEALAEARRATLAFGLAGRPLDQVDCLNLLALHQIVTGPPGYEAVAREALAQARSLGDPMEYALGSFTTRYLQGWLDFKLQRFAAAEPLLAEAVQRLGDWLNTSGTEVETKRQWVARAAPLHAMLLESLERQGKPREAMAAGQVQQMQELLARRDTASLRAPARAQPALQQVQETGQRTREITARLHADPSAQTQLAPLVATCKAEYFRALNELKRVDPEFDRAVTFRPVSLDQINSALPAGTLLVQFSITDDRLYLFVADSQAIRLVSSPVGRARLHQLVGQVRQDLLRENRLEDARKGLAELYGCLLAPIEAELQACQTLLVAPSGDLYYLPFAALVDSGGRYLAEKKPVALLTDCELLQYLRDPAPRPRASSLLGLGDPDGSLPGARAELKEVASLFPQHQTFVAGEATRARLGAAKGRSVVHLATHGRLDSRDANASSLLLADGLLTCGEIYGLDCQGVRLVTLSACQTGLGPGAGAEVASLSQAFSVAGGRSVLASLWSVSDEATRDLMVAFYRGWLTGQGGAAALRQAQLQMLARPERRHPAQWAGFQLLGDWR